MIIKTKDLIGHVSGHIRSIHFFILNQIYSVSGQSVWEVGLLLNVVKTPDAKVGLARTSEVGKCAEGWGGGGGGGGGGGKMEGTASLETWRLKAPEISARDDEDHKLLAAALHSGPPPQL